MPQTRNQLLVWGFFNLFLKEVKNSLLLNSPFNERTKVSAGSGFYEERTYDPLSGSLLTETNNDGQTVRYGNVEDGRLNRQTMMGKDYQLV
ncbi:hypothetical protein BAG01nite_49450 [Brevibacillus agri]|uniref:RHS repeat protein n=1 Tax=Brevibacillus agri TaxID=51101 RepID=A0ABQ0SZD0_9BACL|nr:hypothetical protein [Brevibacillus agri]MDN4092517.1 hypothetical protein [Brevibacillus agri]MDR9507707.1 hypothetical protein [Brevibacillus agri]MED1642980.1 hypothetical protein [Brevibacillus agri]MED1657045.1 hypothetical protein [Brevibacillus agri]MED1690203.1 hypothetical protein [Brevibacillus agri]